MRMLCTENWVINKAKCVCMCVCQQACSDEGQCPGQLKVSLP